MMFFPEYIPKPLLAFIFYFHNYYILTADIFFIPLFSTAIEVKIPKNADKKIERRRNAALTKTHSVL